MARAAALIVNDGQIALIERRGSRRGALYYLFPGGHEESESPDAAAVREGEEELGLRVAVDRLVARGAYKGGVQYYFTAHILGGLFGTGRGPEMVGPNAPDAGIYAAVWMPIGDLLRLPVYPPEVAALVARAVDEGWPHKAVAVDNDG